jgi:hypothetical protein
MDEETQSTQQKQLNSDIFGDDSEDEPVVQKRTTNQANTAAVPKEHESDDDLFADSDEETTKPSAAKVLVTGDNLLDSDDDNEVVQQSKKGALRRKRGKGQIESGGKIKKRKNTDKNERKGKKLKRRSLEGAGSGDENAGGGDWYDSGDEVQETKEDRNFIDAEDDDNADLLEEYAKDNTNFDEDERDDFDFQGKGKKGSSKASGGGSHGINLKDQDPLSQTLASMKNPKAKVLTDMEKEVLVEKLQRKMAKAVELDNIMYTKQQPALYKIQLLDAVQTTISMKPLHHTLLERDILANLRDWIEPRDANTLPALSVRTAVYELLMQLPCLPDHLKRTNGDKPPIGVTIVALRKHKMETPSNKRMLKELMDKWSRPIFSKSTDIRVGGSGAGSLPASDHPEVQQAILLKYAHNNSSGSSQLQHQSIRSGVSSSQDGPTKKSTGGVGFGSIMGGSAGTGAAAQLERDDEEVGGSTSSKKVVVDLYTRARTPYNTGFLFTQQPELKSIDKTNVMERSLGEGRMKLFKKMSEGSSGKGGGRGTGLGKKSNPRYFLHNLFFCCRPPPPLFMYFCGTLVSLVCRAMDMSVSGRNVKA